jgi:hypothetical protein
MRLLSHYILMNRFDQIGAQVMLCMYFLLSHAAATTLVPPFCYAKTASKYGKMLENKTVKMPNFKYLDGLSSDDYEAAIAEFNYVKTFALLVFERSIRESKPFEKFKELAALSIEAQMQELLPVAAYLGSVEYTCGLLEMLKTSAFARHEKRIRTLALAAAVEGCNEHPEDCASIISELIGTAEDCEIALTSVLPISFEYFNTEQVQSAAGASQPGLERIKSFQVDSSIFEWTKTFGIGSSPEAILRRRFQEICGSKIESGEAEKELFVQSFKLDHPFRFPASSRRDVEMIAWMTKKPLFDAYNPDNDTIPKDLVSAALAKTMKRFENLSPEDCIALALPYNGILALHIIMSWGYDQSTSGSQIKANVLKHCEPYVGGMAKNYFNAVTSCNLIDSFDCSDVYDALGELKCPAAVSELDPFGRLQISSP